MSDTNQNDVRVEVTITIRHICIMALVVFAISIMVECATNALRGCDDPIAVEAVK